MLVRKINQFFRAILKGLDALAPLVGLIVRCWVAYFFFMAGLVKVEHWQATILLFTHEYQVPLLSPYLATILGTGAELLLPLLLVIGYGGRIMILVFFLYNAIAAISYPFLWTPEGGVGLNEHISWALLLAVLMTHGLGKWSLEYWLCRRRALLDKSHG
jgi:putative oxidoreductase